AVRSSGTVEDTAKFSFAGMFQSFLNVHGVASLVQAVKDCWASAFTARLLFYRAKQGLDAELRVAAVVQRMVNASRSGVMFTVNPATNNHDEIVIEAAFGLGEVVVLGSVTPDHYVVDKQSKEIRSVTVARKQFKLVRDERTGDNVQVSLSDADGSKRVLTDDELTQLAELAVLDEVHFAGAPQD